MEKTVHPNSRSVTLFRTPTPDSGYISTFRQAGYEPSCIPVLTETYDTDELSQVLRGGGDGWDGVVISSKRGSEGWIRAASGIDVVRGAGWSSVPLFAVGQSTFNVLSKSNLPPHLLPAPAEERVENSAVDLTPPILSHPSAGSPGAQTNGWLIIRGDKSLDQISGALRHAGKSFKQIIVYRTSEDPLLRQRVENLGGGGWLVFFAPSSAGMVLAHLGDKRAGAGDASPLSPTWRSIHQYRVAAIGETTRLYLEDRGVKVDATADTPDAGGLLRAIRNAEGRSSTDQE